MKFPIIWKIFAAENGCHYFATRVHGHRLVVRYCPYTRPEDPYHWEFAVDGRPQRRVTGWKKGMEQALETLDNPAAMEKIRMERLKGYNRAGWLDQNYVIHSR